MEWTTLQVLHLGGLAAAAIGTHLFMARIRRPFLATLEGVAGAVVSRMAATSEVVAALLYLAFAAVALPFDPVGPPTAGQVENVLDSLGIFLVLVASVQIVSLRMLHRVAHNLEPWPPATGKRDQAEGAPA